MRWECLQYMLNFLLPWIDETQAPYENHPKWREWGQLLTWRGLLAEVTVLPSQSLVMLRPWWRKSKVLVWWFLFACFPDAEVGQERMPCLCNLVRQYPWDPLAVATAELTWELKNLKQIGKEVLLFLTSWTLCGSGKHWGANKNN